MAAIKTMDKIASKWAEVTPQRLPQYQEGVASPRVSWAQAAKAAYDNYKAGITAAISANRYPKGIDKAGDDRWSRMTLAKGPSRWGEGVTLGLEDYSRGFSPFRETISNLTLPPRFARRDPRNLERVRAIVQAMIATKDRIG